jgi:hypothetical protein
MITSTAALTSCAKGDFGTPNAQLELTGELSAAQG